MQGDRSLAGLRVLVTRPAGRADSLIAELLGRGAQVTHVPLLTIAPLDESVAADARICRATRSRILDLDRYGCVIVVSVNAVEHGFEWIRGFWPQLPAGLRWYGIGAATVDALAAEAIRAAAATPSMTSEALLALPDFAELTGQRVLILRGVGGRTALGDALTERGAKVDYAECYRRLPPRVDRSTVAELSNCCFDIVCLNSAETLEQLLALLPPGGAERYRACHLVVPSRRVAAEAESRGMRHVTTAANAGTAATVAALEAIAAATNTNCRAMSGRYPRDKD